MSALYARPAFSASVVAKVLCQMFGRTLTYQDADDDEDLEGAVDITGRVHVQLGADFLIVCVWTDATTLKSWPPWSRIPWACRDVLEALELYPGDRPLNSLE